MDNFGNQDARYFTEAEGVKKLGVRVRVHWNIRGRVVSSEGMVIRMFRVADSGFSVLIRCVTVDGEVVVKLFDKSFYKRWAVELPTSTIDGLYSSRDTPLGKLLSKWPFIK